MTYLWSVFRFAMSRRWVPWHLFCAAAVVLMVWAGVWQWDVAFSEIDANGVPTLNPRNLVYALQWWVFAAFGTWFWFRFLRDQRDAELAELTEAAGAAPEQAQDLSAGPVTPSSSNGSAPSLISLDDSADERRARSRGLLNDSSGQTAQVESGADLGTEGKRP